MKLILKFILIYTLGITFVNSGNAQDLIFEVEASTDTLYLGNLVEIKYTIKNVDGEFSPPDFGGMVLVGGPNTSNQYSMINGKVSQSSSYSYVLQPITKGIYTVSEAQFKSKGSIFRSAALQIVAIANPDGRVQELRGFKIKIQDLTRDSLNKYQIKDSSETVLPRLRTKKI